MLPIVTERKRRKAEDLVGIFDKLGLKLDVTTFEHRLRIQKIVYILQLHREFRKYLDYRFNLYIRGPYSPDLASVYYGISEEVHPSNVELSEEALRYGREVVSKDNEYLEVASTLVEAMKVNQSEIDDEELVELVHWLKPYYGENKIREILQQTRELLDRYGITI